MIADMMEEKNFDDSNSDSDFQISSENLSDKSLTSESESTTSESNEFLATCIKQKIKKKKTKNNPKSFSKKSGQHILDIEKNVGGDNVTPEKEEERTDMLWNSFIKCTDVQSKQFENNSQESAENSQTLKTTLPKPNSILENDKNHGSNFAKASRFKQIKNNICNIGIKTKINAPQTNDLKRKGLSNVLSSISKRSKVNTLEKSKQDWNQFKEEHNLNEEINSFNRGKNGYLERQDFLQRTDSRQFEIEKELRSSGRRKKKNL